MKFMLLALIFLLTFCADKSNLQVIYYESGDTAVVYNQKNGVKEGSFKELYPGGELKRKGFYKNGLKEGVVETFYKGRRLAEYCFFIRDTVVYATQFDENGNLLNCNLGVKVSNKTYEKRINNGDTLQIGYSLIHSMVEDPYIVMDIVKIENGERDTINIVNNYNTSINYDLTDYNVGWNTIEITIYEIQKSTNSIICSLHDTLNFEVTSLGVE